MQYSLVSVDVGDVRERIGNIDGCYIALPDPVDIAAKLHNVFTGARRVAGRCKMEEISLKQIALRLKELYDEVLQCAKDPASKCSRPEQSGLRQ